MPEGAVGALPGGERRRTLVRLMPMGEEADGPAAMLARRDAAGTAAEIRALDADTVAAIRGSFASVGTCSTDEPVAELVSLGLAASPERFVTKDRDDAAAEQ